MVVGPPAAAIAATRAAIARLRPTMVVPAVRLATAEAVVRRAEVGTPIAAEADTPMAEVVDTPAAEVYIPAAEAAATQVVAAAIPAADIANDRDEPSNDLDVSNQLLSM